MEIPSDGRHLLGFFFPRTSDPMGLPLEVYIRRALDAQHQDSEESTEPEPGEADAECSMAQVPLNTILTDLDNGVLLLKSLEKFVLDMRAHNLLSRHPEQNSVFNSSRGSSRDELLQLAQSTSEQGSSPSISAALMATCDFCARLDATANGVSAEVQRELCAELKRLSTDLKSRRDEYLDELRRAENSLKSSERTMRQRASAYHDAKIVMKRVRRNLEQAQRRAAGKKDSSPLSYFSSSTSLRKQLGRSFGLGSAATTTTSGAATTTTTNTTEEESSGSSTLFSSMFGSSTRELVKLALTDTTDDGVASDGTASDSVALDAGAIVEEVEPETEANMQELQEALETATLDSNASERDLVENLERQQKGIRHAAVVLAQCEEQYANQRRKLTIQLQHRDILLVAVTTALSDLSLLYRSQLGKVLRGFLASERARVQEETKHLEELERFMHGLDPSGDVGSFANRVRNPGQAFQLQARAVHVVQQVCEAVASEDRQQAFLLEKAEEGEAITVLPAIAVLVFGREEGPKMARRLSMGGMDKVLDSLDGEPAPIPIVSGQVMEQDDDETKSNVNNVANTAATPTPMPTPASSTDSLRDLLARHTDMDEHKKIKLNPADLTLEDHLMISKAKTRAPLAPYTGVEGAANVLCDRLEHGGSIARAGLLHSLNRFRPSNSMTSGHSGYKELSRVLRVLLNCAERENDVKVAKTAMMLAQTFHFDAGEENVAAHEGADVAQTAQTGESSGSSRAESSANRQFLKDELLDHPIWKSETYWHELVKVQLREVLAPLAEEDDTWLDKANSEDSRRDLVLHVHNAVFGQLASVGHSMLELGYDHGKVRDFIGRHGREYQLPQGQCEELLAHMKAFQPS